MLSKAKVDIFGLDLLLVPVHTNNHWSLAVIHVKSRVSFGGWCGLAYNLRHPTEDRVL